MAAAGSNKSTTEAMAELKTALSFENKFSDCLSPTEMWQCNPLPDRYYSGFALKDTDIPFANANAVKLCLKIRIASAK